MKRVSELVFVWNKRLEVGEFAFVPVPCCGERVNFGDRGSLHIVEFLGILCFYGFVIIGSVFCVLNCYSDNYVLVRKGFNLEKYRKSHYGLFISLPRIGMGGGIINVYKIRSMYKYAEYLQDYIFRMNALKESGKFNNDFRVTKVGRFLRRYYIDELPMFLNLLKGDLKLVGVRPVSEQYFALFCDRLQQMRLKTKPGLLPPYCAWRGRTGSFIEVQSREIVYLRRYFKRPIFTDLCFFFRIIFNVLFCRMYSE